MLSIGKLTVEQSRYYERQVAQGRDDYYSGRGESPGRWTGAGAENLRLGGRVDDEGFMVLMEGRDPETGERLKRVGGRSRVAAFDLTFSAPKSVSVLFAVGEPVLAGALVEAHESAVDAALGYLEREACRVRRGRGGAERQVGDGFVAAAYRHRMSRAEDPQLHTHVVAANMARGGDGRWTALDATPIYQHAKAAGFLYQAHLRAAVRERLPWVRWGPVRNGMAEIEQIAPAVLNAVVEILLDARSLRIRRRYQTAGHPGSRGPRNPGRKRTLSSRPGPPPGSPAPFVAGAPFAAGPPREPFPLALTFACSERPSERTDRALSTRLASRRSTRTSSESWPEPHTVPFNQCSSRSQGILPDVRLASRTDGVSGAERLERARNEL